MTTAAYSVKGGIIAVDSRLCRGNTIVSDNCNKIIKSDKGAFVLSGDHQATVELSETYPEPPSMVGNCSGFAVINSEVLWVSLSDGVLQVSICNFDESTGSGQDHALTALDLGFDAVEAVKSAMKRDVSTGGKVRVLNVKTLDVDISNA